MIDRLLQPLGSVSSGDCCISLLNATAPSWGDLRGRRFIKRLLLSRPQLSVLGGQSGIDVPDWTLNTGILARTVCLCAQAAAALVAVLPHVV